MSVRWAATWGQDMPSWSQGSEKGGKDGSRQADNQVVQQAWTVQYYHIDRTSGIKTGLRQFDNASQLGKELPGNSHQMDFQSQIVDFVISIVGDPRLDRAISFSSGSEAWQTTHVLELCTISTSGGKRRISGHRDRIDVWLGKEHFVMIKVGKMVTGQRETRLCSRQSYIIRSGSKTDLQTWSGQCTIVSHIGGDRGGRHCCLADLAMSIICETGL